MRELCSAVLRVGFLAVAPAGKHSHETKIPVYGHCSECEEGELDVMRSYILALDRAKAMQQAEKELPPLLVQLWNLRLKELQGSSKEELFESGGVRTRIRALEDQVVGLQTRMVDLAGVAGLARYHAIVDQVVQSTVQEVFRLLQARQGTGALADDAPDDVER